MIDLIIVGFYLVLLLFIGIYKRSGNTGLQGFSSIKDSAAKNSKLILVATIFASSIGGGTTFGLSEKVFADNAAYAYGLFLAIPIDILIGIYLVPRLVARHYSAETIGDIMFCYYGRLGRNIGGSAAILVSVGFIAAQISVSGRIFEYILQIDYTLGVIISYAVVVIYTTIGGFRSVLFTNLFQFFAILVAIPVVSVFGLYELKEQAGSWHELARIIPLEKIALWGSSSSGQIMKTTISAFLGFAVMNFFPTFIQRALINKHAHHTTRAIYIKSAIYAVFLMFIMLNGLIAYVIYPNISPRLALPCLIDHIIPVGIQGIVVTGLLAAVMSTADSDLNITSITLVKDFFKPLFNLSNQGHMLLIARITNVLMGSTAILIALYFDSVVDLVIFIAGFWAPVILVPMVFGLYDVTVSNLAMGISSLLGSAVFLLWEYYMAYSTSLKGVFVGTFTSFITFLSLYLMQKYVNFKTFN